MNFQDPDRPALVSELTREGSLARSDTKPCVHGRICVCTGVSGVLLHTGKHSCEDGANRLNDAHMLY